MTVLVNLGKLLTGLVSIKLLHPCLTVSAVTVQVNLGKLLTGLGSCELLHPQNSVLGATVSRLALYGLGVEVTESSTNKQHHLSIVCRRRMRLSGEVLELKKGQRAPQHQLQPPPHRLRSRHVVCFISQLAQACTSHATELAHLQAHLVSSQGSLRTQHETHKAQHAS